MLRNGFSKWQIATCFLLVLSILPSVNAYDRHRVELNIYSFPETYRSEILFSYFNNKSDCKVIFHSLNDSAASETFLEILNILVMQSVKIVDFCSSCIPRDIWTEIRKIHVQPLIGFFHQGNLTAITVGNINYAILDVAFMRAPNPNGDVEIFTPYGVYHLSDKGIKARLEELFVEKKIVMQKQIH